MKYRFFQNAFFQNGLYEDLWHLSYTTSSLFPLNFGNDIFLESSFFFFSPVMICFITCFSIATGDWLLFSEIWWGLWTLKHWSHPLSVTPATFWSLRLQTAAQLWQTLQVGPNHHPPQSFLLLEVVKWPIFSQWNRCLLRGEGMGTLCSFGKMGWQALPWMRTQWSEVL